MTQERFEFTWPGKKAAKAEAKQKSKCRLAPSRRDSKNWDETENLYIEGDNLDALKLLKKEYAGKVKVIFIDPPYNTGINHFVYADDRYSSHGLWCSMMYPRLALAHELLKDDGVIFISLDDGENAHTRMMMDEIFGEENFIADFIWEKKKKPSFLHRNVGKIFDYILCYAKKAENTEVFSVERTAVGKKYPLNNAGNPLRTLLFPPGSVVFDFNEQVIEAQDMSEGNINTRLLDRLVVKNFTNQTEMRLEGEWRYSQNKLDELIAAGEKISIHKIPFRPNHIRKGNELKAMKTILSPGHYGCETNEDGSGQIMEIFGCNVFETPKPVGLIKLLLLAVTYRDTDALILDFFSGSATTAHSVMALNAEDGGNRKFIMVQAAEECNAKSEAVRLGYKTISEIGMDRIRKSERIIRECFGVAADSVDMGFKVYRVK